MGEPADITFDKDGRGKFAFGALNATTELEYARCTVFFAWAGFDEGDEITRTGSADLDDGRYPSGSPNAQPPKEAR